MGSPVTRQEAVLVVRAGGRRLGLPARLVRRVVRDLPVYPVPGSAPRFAGLAQLGGEPVPVLDLGVEIGAAEPTGAPTRLVVVVDVAASGGVLPVALAVDEAVDIAVRDGAPGIEVDPADAPQLEVFDPSRLGGCG